MSGGKGEPPVDSFRYLVYIGLILGLLWALGAMVRAL
jgi:hypothetical protein